VEAKRIRKVVIAGGGTAGWLAAAALSRQLNRLLEISLVESDEIGTVGVGESTIPTVRSFNALLGLDEPEFMRATQATFKLGISFEDWARVGDRYIHSFGQLGTPTWIADFHHFWLEARARGLAGELGDYCFELQAAQAGRFATEPDASEYGRYLRGRSERQGVHRIEGKIATVEQDPKTGFLTALLLQSGERVEGDLFIDCTGFRGLLIEQVLKAGYEDWSHWLATDSALAVQTASLGPGHPYTRAIAHPAGWQWRIPLQHRVGNGLVYASAHMSDEDARRLLAERIEGEALTEPRLIRYKAGRRRKSWDRNCIALGLASGFVEPLESTSIHLIMIAVTRLMQVFPFGGISEAVVDRFNEQARNELERIRDFIILHYKLTERDDSSFWRMCRDMEVPDTLRQRIALFRDAGLVYQASDDLFRTDSWVQVMLGQRLQPLSHHKVGQLMPPQRMEQSLAELKRNIAAAVERMPTHQEFVERYCAPAAG
jgi:tryptophan 7-halogenase